MGYFTPFFSIILPTYNRANFIGKAVDSVLSQTFSNFELIIVDDGSEDNTKSIINKFPDSRIRYFWKENGERGAARNYGLLHAKGEFICFLDSDDYYYKNHLQVLKKLVDETQSLCFHPSYEFVNEQGLCLAKVIMDKPISFSQIATHNILSMDAACIHRDIALNHQFSEDRNFIMGEDLHFWLRILSKYKIQTSFKITSAVFEHSKRTVNTINPDKIIYSIKQITNLLENNDLFNERHQVFIPLISGYFHSTAAYFYMCKGSRKKGLKSFVTALKFDFRQLFVLRTLSIIYRFFKPKKTHV